MTSKKVFVPKKLQIISKQDELDELNDLEDLEALSDALDKSNGIEVGKKKVFINGKISNFQIGEEIPKNYGMRWSSEDKETLLKLLKKYSGKEIDFAELANKLGRSEGGVKGEIKKIILSRYLAGEDCDSICESLQVQYKFVKMIVINYMESEAQNDINNLERENKLLKLRMENMELRNKISQIVSTK